MIFIVDSSYLPALNGVTRTSTSSKLKMPGPAGLTHCECIFVTQEQERRRHVVYKNCSTYTATSKQIKGCHELKQ